MNNVKSAPRRRPYSFFMRLLAFCVIALVGGNLLILGAHLTLHRTPPERDMRGVKNFAVVDDRVVRGAAPTPDGYRALAADGIKTIIDLRAERDIVVDEELVSDLGLRRVHMPMRDGQAPSPKLVEEFLSTVEASDGPVFVHCGAGVGRTGTMVAAYLVESGMASPGEAVRHNLSVGPPSLEQIAFAAGLHRGDIRRPNPALVALSRALDAPRRGWVGVRHSYSG
jgi:protein tyrosine phosphatase (PTP) superfamily phosphohydrolase (DUF442 family)